MPMCTSMHRESGGRPNGPVIRYTAFAIEQDENGTGLTGQGHTAIKAFQALAAVEQEENDKHWAALRAKSSNGG